MPSAASGYGLTTIVRASTDYGALNAGSVVSTATNDMVAVGDAIGMIVSVDQTAVAVSSAGGGTGVLTHTIQYKDPIGGTYTGTTGVIVMTTGIGTFVLQCYPGGATFVAPTSAAMGKADLAVPGVWRINTTSSSSATITTYSIAAVYIPTGVST